MDLRIGPRRRLLRISRALALTCGLALLVGCAGSPSRSSEPRSTSSSCAELLERYRAALATGTGRCASDVDCQIYGGVDPDAVCGGTIDAETGRLLTQIASERDAANCPRPGYSCPPIEPRCVEATCR